MDSMETKKKLTTILIHVILIIVSITMLVPFIWMILTAFKSVTEATSVDPFTIFPKIWRKDAFISVINNMNRLAHASFQCFGFNQFDSYRQADGMLDDRSDLFGEHLQLTDFVREEFLIHFHLNLKSIQIIFTVYN